MQLYPRTGSGTGVCVQPARTCAIAQTRGVRIPSGCARVRALRRTRFRRRPVISVRGAMRWALFMDKNALPLRRKGVRAAQSVLDDLGDIGVEELLPFGLGRVPELLGV